MINIVIADDSAFLRQVLKDVLERSNKIKVVAAAKNGKEALELIEKHKPDLAIFDVEMPVMTGLEALRRVMGSMKLPVIMFSSLTREGASVTIKALEYGAVDFLVKPTSGAHGLEEVAQQLIKKVELIAMRSKPSASTGKVGGASGTLRTAAIKTSAISVPKKKIDLVALGSSTGGVQAGMKVIQNLPAEFPPIVWVQHMPMHFTERFAERLNTVSKLTVKEAKNGDVIENNCVYLAPGGLQMRVANTAGKLSLKIGGTDKVSGFCPSCDVLFESVATNVKNNLLGVILTGMGRDGATGLKRMHDDGAYVIGQDEASCVVYGMPKVAFEEGGVDVQVDINEIAGAMQKVCGK